VSSKTASARLRERLEKRAAARELFAQKAPEDVKRLEEIQVRLRDCGPTLTSRALSALKLEIETIFRKLAKILPDEKVVEHDIGENVATSLTDDELDSRITELLRQAGIARATPAEAEAPPQKPN
jgi:hypothetical protein